MDGLKRSASKAANVEASAKEKEKVATMKAKAKELQGKAKDAVGRAPPMFLMTEEDREAIGIKKISAVTPAEAEAADGPPAGVMCLYVPEWTPYIETSRCQKIEYLMSNFASRYSKDAVTKKEGPSLGNAAWNSGRRVATR